MLERISYVGPNGRNLCLEFLRTNPIQTTDLCSVCHGNEDASSSVSEVDRAEFLDPILSTSEVLIRR
jgi:hypothetical protein